MTGSGLDFFLVSLAVWRASSLFAREEGPFDLLLHLRILLGTKFDVNSEEIGTGWISKGILCVWCNSIWFGVLGALLLAQNFVQYLVFLLALSAVAIIIDDHVTE